MTLTQDTVTAILGETNEEDGLSQVPNVADGLAKAAVQNGRPCRTMINNGSPTRYMYFNVQNDFIHAQTTKVAVSVDFYYEGTGSLALQYDSSDFTAEPLEGRFKTTEWLKIENSSSWQTVTFHLPDAYFGDRQHNNISDFRIASNQDLSISLVAVSKDTSASPQPPNSQPSEDFLGVGVDLGKISVDKPLMPGGTCKFPPISIINTGRVAGDYEIAVSFQDKQMELQPPAGWFEFAPKTVTLKPGQNKSMTITLHVPTNAQPGNYFAYLEAHPMVREEGVAINVAAATTLCFSVISGQTVFSTDTDVISVTTEVAQVALTAPITIFDYGIVPLNTKNVKPRGASALEIKNAGNCWIDIFIKGAGTSGGWVLGDTAGPETYVHYFVRGGPSHICAPLSVMYRDLHPTVSSYSPGSTQGCGSEMDTPTMSTASGVQNTTLTFMATFVDQGIRLILETDADSYTQGDGPAILTANVTDKDNNPVTGIPSGDFFIGLPFLPLPLLIQPKQPFTEIAPGIYTANCDISLLAAGTHILVVDTHSFGRVSAGRHTLIITPP